MDFTFDIKTSCKFAFNQIRERCHANDSSTRNEAAQVIGTAKLFKGISPSYTQFQIRSEGEHLEKKHYHLIGICGTAMASLAGMLAEQGHKVSGSDENVYPPMSLELERLGIPVREGYKPDNLVERPDVVVVGNAITRGNPELEQVLNQKIYYTSMAAVVKNNFIRGHN